MATGDVINRSTLLCELGYAHPEAQRAAIEALVAAGLTTQKKTGIAASKRRKCRDVLSQALVRLCERCRTDHVSDGRMVVPTAHRAECDQCAGSRNRLAMQRAAEVFRRHGLRRLVVVGGSPGVHRELKALWPSDLQLRVVPGTDRHVEAAARANVAWADVVIVWGSSELAHKVSRLYTAITGPDARKVISVDRRGIQALAERISRHLA
jgi:hypothetical protein